MDTIIVHEEQLFQLIKTKIEDSGLPSDQAHEVANHLVYADLSGIHSHGAVRVDYYAERISKGGITKNPNLKWEQTGPATAIVHGDNGMGHYVVNKYLPEAISLAKEIGVAIVGFSKVSHTGTMGYYLEKIAENKLIGISMCQSDPMVVPFGGTSVFYGTNPIGFSVPSTDEPIVFDMATSVQAWGKILDARSKGKSIPRGWAVNKDGEDTEDPFDVGGLLPISGPKGYGLMMMVDMLSGVLLGLPNGKNVSSMYEDLSEGRNLGHIIILIDPEKFIGIEKFSQAVETQIKELHSIRPKKGLTKVMYPGETSKLKYLKSKDEGIEIPINIYEYLTSNIIHYDKYSNTNPFREK